MTEKKEIEIFVAMNEDGDFVAHEDGDEVGGILAENHGGSMRRIVKITVCMAPPTIESGPTIDIPDTAGTTEQIEVEAA